MKWKRERGKAGDDYRNRRRFRRKVGRKVINRKYERMKKRRTYERGKNEIERWK
jgi:hypothetical protein